MAVVDVGSVVCDWRRELFGDGLASLGSLQPQRVRASLVLAVPATCPVHFSLFGRHATLRKCIGDNCEGWKAIALAPANQYEPPRTPASH